MKFFDYAITFREMPFSKSGSLTFYTGGQCKHHCNGCSWGEKKPECDEMPLEVFAGIVKKKRKHTGAVCFLGEGENYQELIPYLTTCKYYGMSTMLYTGGSFDDFEFSFLQMLDYIKVGEWQGKTLYEAGTNQKVYKLCEGLIEKEIKFYEDYGF